MSQIDKVTICELQQHHIQDATRILTKSFISMNKIWKHYNLNYDDIYRIMRGKIIAGQDQKINFVLFQNDKLIGVSIAYDFLIYLNTPDMPNNLPFFKKLSEVGKNLQKDLDVSKNKLGDIVYGLYAVIDPDYASKGYSIRFWWESLLIAKAMGFKYYYSRLSSPISLKILQKMGAEILKDYQLIDGDFKQKFWLVKIDFSKPLPSYQKVKQMLSKKKQVKSKL